MRLECYYQNVGGLRTKLNDLKRNFELSSYNVVMFSESWLNDAFTVSEVKFAGYEVYRSDRNAVIANKTRGGGVLIAVRCNLRSSLVPVATPSRSFDQLFVTVNISGQSYIFGCTYIPPSSPLEVYAEHCSAVEDLVSRHPEAQLFLSGDYNLELCYLELR